MNRINGIIFDMDGLMVDSEPMQFRAINDALVPFGVKVEEPEFIDMVGRKAIENFRTIVQEYKLPISAEELNRKKTEAYLQRIKTELEVMPGFFAVLEMFERAGFTTAIASSSPKRDILEVLDILSLTDRFGVIASGDEVKHGKPDPAIFLNALERLEGEAAQYLVLEDTAHGVNAAKAAGMYCIAVPNYYTRTQDFIRADRVLDSLEQLDMELVSTL